MRWLFSLFVVWVCREGVMAECANGGEAWYVPGWLKTGEPEADDETWTSFTKTFPESRPRFHAWDGTGLWTTSRDNADKAAVQLAERIAAMGESRTNLTLVGHSLGGRMVVRTLARLHEKRLKIRQGILLAPAIPNNDPDVAVMGAASTLPVLNVCNPEDITLRFIYRLAGGESAAALGAGGALTASTNVVEQIVPAKIMKEAEVEAVWGRLDVARQIANHHVLFYFATVRRMFDGSLPEDDRILIPQGKLNLELKVSDREIWWDVLAFEKGWKLERNIVTRHCRILDPSKRRVAWGREADMRQAFGKILSATP